MKLFDNKDLLKRLLCFKEEVFYLYHSKTILDQISYLYYWLFWKKPLLQIKIAHNFTLPNCRYVMSNYGSLSNLHQNDCPLTIYYYI
ncbi:hypothetical protein BpHYR1_047941 [Brachionus plicatilis]|uniref:Uncharacterized protein n=1 Tax=Brachionus plicatilis TaxID=10195 RepID=A0A3M7S158_BRAPC|nr:hypothetical protein BpHYR1_047941 [Brachionus plicatilis]